MTTTFTTLRTAMAGAFMLLAACSGKTLGNTDGGTGGEAGSGGGSGGGGGSSSGGPGCVDVSLSSFDTSCRNDGDCTTVTVGELCPDSCLCGGAAISVSSQAAWKQATAGLGGGFCGCPLEGIPQCVAGTCAICNDPASCGVTTSDAGTSTSDATANQCVNIPPSTYSTSCNVESDCTSLRSGEVCSGECNCGGTAVNVSGEAAFEKATQGFVFEGCPCASLPLACVGGTCAFCNGPLGCVDGG
jgi:hypothetical protein